MHPILATFSFCSAFLSSLCRRSQTVRSEVGITSRPTAACGPKPPAAGNLLRNWRGSEGLSLVSTLERTSTAYLQQLLAACFLKKSPKVQKYCVGELNRTSEVVKRRRKLIKAWMNNLLLPNTANIIIFLINGVTGYYWQSLNCIINDVIK